MNEGEIKEMVFALLKNAAPETDPATLDADDNIRRALDIDSFDFLQFIVAISEKTGYDIPEKDYGKITTLRELLKYLMDKQY